jgi:hypothetical protein
MPPVGCGVGRPAIYQNDITLIGDLSKVRRSRWSASGMEQAQRNNPPGSRSKRAGINEDTGVIVPVGGGQDQAAVAGAPVPLPHNAVPATCPTTRLISEHRGQSRAVDQGAEQQPCRSGPGLIRPPKQLFMLPRRCRSSVAVLPAVLVGLPSNASFFAPKPGTMPGHLASPDTSAAPKLAVARGWRRRRDPQVRARICKRICKRDAAGQVETGRCSRPDKMRGPACVEVRVPE